MAEYDDTNPGDCPELNMSNYDHDDVAALNAWAIQAAFCIERLERDAKRYHYLRRTTTAVRDSKGERVEVTPELMDVVIDERIATNGVGERDAS